MTRTPDFPNSLAQERSNYDRRLGCSGTLCPSLPSIPDSEDMLIKTPPFPLAIIFRAAARTK